MTKVYRIWLLFILLFTACASEPPVYTPLDYTTEDALNNEIKEICNKRYSEFLKG